MILDDHRDLVYKICMIIRTEITAGQSKSKTVVKDRVTERPMRIYFYRAKKTGVVPGYLTQTNQPWHCRQDCA